MPSAKIKGFHRDVVVPAFQNVAEAAQRLIAADMGARTMRVALGDKERLGEVVLELADAFDYQSVAGCFRRIAGALQCRRKHPTHLLRDRPVLFRDRPRLDQPRAGRPQIDGRTDLCLGDLARQMDHDIGGGEIR
jgi:hypothetical protein